jgi:hypothetical protein
LPRGGLCRSNSATLSTPWKSSTWTDGRDESGLRIATTLRDAIGVRRAQHRQTVVHQQRPRGLEGLDGAQLPPERRVLLGQAEIVAGVDRIHVALQPGARQLDGQRAAVGVRHQHGALAQLPHRDQEIGDVRQEVDMVLGLALQRRDIETELATPVIQAVPLERPPGRREPRLEHRDGLLVRQAVQGRVARRDELLPEEIVEPEVEQRAVHIQQHGVVMVPLERMARDDLHGPVSYTSLPPWSPARDAPR